jgi:hypothetical protein
MKRHRTDISDLIERKEAGRREASGRSFAEKIAMVEALRDRVRPLKEMREQNRRAPNPSGQSASTAKL